ncbi:MAG: ATP-binding protein [Armatimonadota bacterium]
MILRNTMQSMIESALVPVIRRMAIHPLKELGVIEEDVDRVATIITEACSNVVKYAYDGKGEYRVDIEYRAGSLTVTVTDHGRGFDLAKIEPPKPGRIGGYGLSLIRESANKVDITSVENEGTSVRAEVALRYRNESCREQALRLDGG